MYILLCAIALVSSVTVEGAKLKTVRVSSVFNDHLVTQDITDDPDRNTVLIVTGEVKGFKDYKTSVNLHDFNTGYVAIKNVADGRCLLKPLGEKKREHIPGLNAASDKKGQKFLSWQKTMYWYVNPKILQYEQVKAEAGENLAEFCRDYTTNLLIPRKINGQLKELKEKDELSRTKRCWFRCGWCFNQVDGYDQNVVDMDYKAGV